MITAKCDAAELIAKLSQAPAKLRESIASLIEQSADAVAERAREKLSGEVLREKTGRLKASIAASASDLAGRVTADAPYAHIQEYGGRIDVPEIAPKTAKALAFEYEGKLAFAKSAAAHSVSIPQRSYLRSALAECAQGFLDAARKVLMESLT
jgi:phage gpG-like protein